MVALHHFPTSHGKQKPIFSCKFHHAWLLGRYSHLPEAGLDPAANYVIEWPGKIQAVMNFRIHRAHHISDFPEREWDALTQGHPLLSHAYLHALESSGSACAITGWEPAHLAVVRGGAIRAAMPLYKKTHSMGEYVFDQAWAHAYARYGMSYYPKLVCAVPFTPVPGPRLLALDHNDRLLLIEAAKRLASHQGCSSLHVLFPHEEDHHALRQSGLMFRGNVQFHWLNAGYATFGDFLSALTASKRKKLRQERRRVLEAGISFQWLEGSDIDEATLRFLYLCYVRTYHAHGHRPHLNLDFFERLHSRLASHMVIVLASMGNTPIAAALNLRHDKRLFGRYWGAIEFVPGLHFETCYLQGIEYCISHGLKYFEGGAQGEHKLARGMMPVATWSAHWVEDPVFAPAVSDFLKRETSLLAEYMAELEAHSPYRTD